MNHDIFNAVWLLKSSQNVSSTNILHVEKVLYYKSDYKSGHFTVSKLNGLGISVPLVANIGFREELQCTKFFLSRLYCGQNVALLTN